MTHDEIRPPLSTPPERLFEPFTEEELRSAKTTDLAKTLADRLVLLARKEVELAQAEAKAEVRRGMMLGGLAGGTGVFFVAALCCGLVSAILAIGYAFGGNAPIWVALLGCGLFLAFGVAAGALAAIEGREMKPERSIRQAKRTIQFLRRPQAT